MNISLRAGKPADQFSLVNVPQLITAYYAEVSDPSVPAPTGCLRYIRPSRVLAQAVLQRTAYPRHQPGHLSLPKEKKIDGPLFLGMDTHALSVPALK